MPLAFSTSVVKEVSDFEHAVAQVPDIALLGATGIVLRVHAKAWLEMLSGEASVVEAMRQQALAVQRRAPGVDVYVIPDGHSSAEGRPPFTARHGARLLVDGQGARPIFDQADSATAVLIRQQDLALLIESA